MWDRSDIFCERECSMKQLMTEFQAFPINKIDHYLLTPLSKFDWVWRSPKSGKWSRFPSRSYWRPWSCSFRPAPLAHGKPFVSRIGGELKAENGRGLSVRHVHDALASCITSTGSPFAVGFAGIWPIPLSINHALEAMASVQRPYLARTRQARGKSTGELGTKLPEANRWYPKAS